MKKSVYIITNALNCLFIIGVIAAAIYTFINLDNWAILLLWVLTSPVQLIMIVSSVIVLVKTLKNKRLNNPYYKHSFYLLSINIISIIVILIIVFRA